MEAIKFDFNNMMSDFIGEQGIKASELDNPVAKAAFDYFKANRGTQMMGWADLPYNQDGVVEDIIATAKEINNNFENFVVLGIGGSALGPIAVFTALCHFRYNDLPKE